jgi:hypothetical protein
MMKIHLNMVQLQDAGCWTDAATLAATHLHGSDYARYFKSSNYVVFYFSTFSMYFIFLTLFHIDTHIHMTAWPIHPGLGTLDGGSK